jgi:hypothetical protein
MARLFTEEEVRQMVAKAVAKAVAPLMARIAELEAEVARLKKNSRTSSKPPSSDIVKPPRPSGGSGKRRGKRRGGGQPGHLRHTRPAFPPEQVVKTVQKASAALGPCYEQLQKALPEQTSMGIDETGHRERGHGLWSWCFHVPGQDRFTWFHIDPSRGSKVLKQYLGKEFEGIIGCDYFSAYRKFLRETNVSLQLCWAHLIRDVKYLTTLSDRATRGYGQRSAFEFIHHSIVAYFNDQPFPSLLPLPP